MYERFDVVATQQLSFSSIMCLVLPALRMVGSGGKARIGPARR